LRPLINQSSARLGLILPLSSPSPSPLLLSVPAPFSPLPEAHPKYTHPRQRKCSLAQAAYGGRAAVDSTTPLASSSPAPSPLGKDQGGRDKVQTTGGAPVSAVAAGEDVPSGKRVAIDEKTGFRDVAVKPKAAREKGAADTGLVEKGLETLDPGSTQVDKVSTSGKVFGMAQNQNPYFRECF
jgi:hypothetical protein